MPNACHKLLRNKPIFTVYDVSLQTEEQAWSKAHKNTPENPRNYRLSKFSFHVSATPIRLVQVVRRCPSMPQFSHFLGLRGFLGASPLSGHIVRLSPSRLHMLQNLVRLLSPSYGAFSLQFVGLPTPLCFSGTVSPCRAFTLTEFAVLMHFSAISLLANTSNLSVPR